MPSIVPIPISRVSDFLIRQRLLRQLQFDQKEMFRIQNSVSTGRAINLPSDNPTAALRAISLQRLIERKEQVQINLATNQSYLSATDSALSSVSSSLAEVRATALSVIGDSANSTERTAAIQQIDRVIRHLVNTANRKFRGRFLFSGTRTDQVPFEIAQRFVKYHGNENPIQSFADIGLLFNSNVNGNEVFGAISQQVQGFADLNPIITAETKLSDLRGGLGISDGSIAVAVGTVVSLIDLSIAATVGDVVKLIENDPPSGHQIIVTITSEGLDIQADSGVLTIKEVGGGTLANELGILEETGSLGAPIIGSDLNPRLTRTTLLDDILGSRAFVRMDSSGINNAFIIEANQRGAAFNGLVINFLDDPAVLPGSEVVVYDPNALTLTVRIANGQTTANDVVTALTNDAVFSADFTIRLDPREVQDTVFAGTGLIDVSVTGTTSDGSGVEFDKASGLQIVNGNQTFTASFATAETVEDMLNIINGLNAVGAAVRAEINQDATGINIRSLLSGTDFSVGENGGTTATELGIRSFTDSTRFVDLNHSRGVNSVDGTDFTIQRSDGVTLDIDVSGAETIRDVLDLVNNHVSNQDGPNRVVARLNTYGNGIELYSTNPSTTTTFSVIRANQSSAAIDLGLIPEGSNASDPSIPVTSSTAKLTLTGPNTDLALTAVQAGSVFNGIDIVLIDDGSVTGNAAVVQFDQGLGRLNIFVDNTATTSLTLRNQINAEGTFLANLDLTSDPTNDGSGLVVDTGTMATTAGGAVTISGRDVNPQEVEGIFSALIRLRDALEQNNVTEMGRAVDMLDDGAVRLTFSRADIGTRQQSLESLQNHLALEEIELRGSLSEDIDVDLAEAVSEMTARKISFEASLRLTAMVSQITLLDFL